MADKEIKVILDDVVAILISDTGYLVMYEKVLESVDVPYNKQTVEALVAMSRKRPDLPVEAMASDG